MAPIQYPDGADPLIVCEQRSAYLKSVLYFTSSVSILAVLDILWIWSKHLGIRPTFRRDLRHYLFGRATFNELRDLERSAPTSEELSVWARTLRVFPRGRTRGRVENRLTALEEGLFGSYVDRATQCVEEDLAATTALETRRWKAKRRILQVKLPGDSDSEEDIDVGSSRAAGAVTAAVSDDMSADEGSSHRPEGHLLGLTRYDGCAWRG